MRIGVIADTHGKVLPEVFSAFDGVNLILHAGDIGGDYVMSDLETIARVVAVRGNTDIDLRPPQFPDTRLLVLDGVKIFLCHEPYRAQGLADAPRLIIHGHTHVARMEEVNGVLWFNPGTAGKPQFGKNTLTVGLLTIEGGEVRAEIVTLR